MNIWKILSDVPSSVDRDKRIYIIQCKKCGSIKEEMMDDISKLSKIKCDKCEATGNTKTKIRESHSQAKVDDNFRYRLKTIWLKLQKEDKLANEWKDSFENFRDWSISNRYAYYKILDRKNKKIKYRPTNCIWVVNRSISVLNKVEDTLSGKVRVYTNILSRTSSIDEHLCELCNELDIIEGLSGINKEEVIKLRKKLNKVLKEVKDMYKAEETIWPDKDKVEYRG